MRISVAGRKGKSKHIYKNNKVETVDHVQTLREIQNSREKLFN